MMNDRITELKAENAKLRKSLEGAKDSYSRAVVILSRYEEALDKIERDTIHGNMLDWQCLNSCECSSIVARTALNKGVKDE